MRQAQRRTWDAAIDTVQWNIFSMVVGRDDVSNEEDRILTAIFRRCEELKAKNCLPIVPTNAEIAVKYGISPRTVRNWQREGCPFAEGQSHVLNWLSRRRYAPAETLEKFDKQLRKRKRKASWVGFNALLNDVRQLKGRYLEAGLTPPDFNIIK